MTDLGKIKITTTQAVKYGLALLTVVGLYYNGKYDVELLKSVVFRNTTEILVEKQNTKQEFKEVHQEMKVMSKEIAKSKDCKEK